MDYLYKIFHMRFPHSAQTWPCHAAVAFCADFPGLFEPFAFQLVKQQGRHRSQNVAKDFSF
jgi:hypothetical protein